MLEINKIYNEDCIKCMKEMEDCSVTMTLTDIPYGEVTKKMVLKELDIEDNSGT